MSRKCRYRNRALKQVVLSLILLLGSATGISAVPEDTIALWKRNYDSPAIRSLLAMALEKTPEFGEARIVSSKSISQARALRHLKYDNRRQVRVANVAASPERNKVLQPIRIPIDQGLLGFRVCLIREGEQTRFESIYSASDFQDGGLRIGQGAHWPDTSILRASGFEVVTSPRFENLFRMLERDRFDCFLRGVGEAFIDLEQHPNKEIVVEERLLFTYPMPSYFFVSPEDDRLAERIEKGLHRAVADGAYEQWFTTYFREPMKRLKLMKRVFIPLPNPFLEGHDSPAQLPLLPVRPDRFLTVPEGTR